MTIEKEYEKLCKRYKIPKDIELIFNKRVLKYYGAGGLYLSGIAIVLPDRRLCRERLVTLLHEIGHAVQYQNNQLITDRRRKRAYLNNELDAECFAYHNYKKYYEKKFGDWGKRSKKLDLIAYIKCKRKEKN